MHTHARLALGAACALTSVVRKVCGGTRRKICIGAQRPEGKRLDTRRLKKKYALTLCVWKAYTLVGIVRTPHVMTLVVWKNYALALAVRKAYAVAGVVRTPHVMTFVVWKKYALTLCVWKRKYLGTRRPECRCRGRRRPDATCFGSSSERHMTWQASSRHMS